MANTIQTQVSLFHIDSGFNLASSIQRTASDPAFTAASISLNTSDETLGLGDVITPKQVAVMKTSGDDVLIGFDGSTYPFRLVEDKEAVIFRLNVEGAVETSTITAIADVASAMSGDYFDLTDRTGTVRVWFNMAATAAFGTINPTGVDNSITYTAVTAGTAGNSITIEYVISGGGSSVTGITVIGSAIQITAGSATSAETVIAAVTADAPSAALVTAAASGTVTGVIDTVAATNLTGGTAASTPPATPGGGRLLPVVIVEDADAGTNATAIAAALEDDDEFSASAAASVVTATDMYAGTRTDIAAGTSGMAVAVTQQGAAVTVVHLKSTGTSQVAVAIAPA